MEGSGLSETSAKSPVAGFEALTEPSRGLDIFTCKSNAWKVNLPSEHRQIVFGKNELSAAMAAYRQSHDDGIPEGRITACSVDAVKRIAVLLAFLKDGEDKPEIVEVSASTVAAALISHCMGKGIPIPRQSHKAVQQLGDNIALVIRVGSQAIAFSETIEIANPFQTARQAE